MADPKHDPSSTSSFSGKDSEGPKEQREGKDRMKSPPKHRRETHGMSDDFDENTPIGDFKGPNVFERAKEEFEALIDTIHPKKESSGLVSGGKNNVTPPKVEVRKEHKEGAEGMKSPRKHRRETHGRSDDFDANTSIDDFKGPNVFERAKEEFEAFIDTIHHKKESGGLASGGKSNVTPPKVEVRKEHKEGADGMKSPRKHRRETHGRSDDFDANTPIDDFKGPNVFERAKEEFEALIDTIHHKKESAHPVSSPDKKSDISPKKKSDIYDCLGPLGKGLEKVCSPGSHKKD